jgi:glucose/arabinose dehydrogenase
MKSIIRFVFFIGCLLMTGLRMSGQKLAVVPYVSGISSPIDIKNCGDDRLFIVDKGGFIRVINGDGTLRPTPFLDISAKIYMGTSEQGLFGMAFSPNYKTDRKFYVDYVAFISGQVTVVIEEYKVSVADSNIADISTALTLLTRSQPTDNDLGGNLMFGKDNYLYVNFGDGGSGGNGQNKNTFLGKILRIDISNSSGAQPYVVPPTNPFYNDPTPGIKKEIWAYGVRNPWRNSVDRITGDLWIADVGQNAVEEVDFQPVNDPGGRNYGWNTMEGSSCFNPPVGCNTTGLTLPIYDYPHTVGATVIGGYIYRSAQSKALFGTYIFGDFTKKWIDGIKQSGGVLAGPVTHFITNAQATGMPISFGEDRYGDQYIIFYGNGTVYKLQDTSYLRVPKAYFTPVDQGTGAFLLQGLEGPNLTYQWLRNNTVIPGATSPDYSTTITGSYTLVVTNTLNFSDTSDPFVLGSLPLNLISFDAQKLSSKAIRLQWKTASEQNVSGYIIMRRQNNEAAFSNIGFVKSKSVNGTSNLELDYIFNDSLTLSNSKLFYRLKIQNTNGSYTYSDIRIVLSDSRVNAFTLFPNPAKGQAQIYLNSYTQPVVLMIYDNTGKKVKEQILNQQGSTIDLPGLTGVYIVQLSNKDGSNVTRNKLVIK